MTTIEARTTERPAAEVLAWSRTVVDPALRAAVDSLPGAMRRIAGYHFGWCDEQGRPARAGGGKALRPALTLLSAEAVGGQSEHAVPAAIAIELAHNFSLLHDDVMDGDRTRRHRPTVWSVFGIGAAILAGDALLTLAVELLLASGHPAREEGVRAMDNAVLRLIEGQCADLDFEQRADVALPECLEMARGKTAALLGCACEIGALFGQGDASQVAGLRAFGEHLGIAFQLVDDLLGVWGDPSVTGKPAHSDLQNRKKSLPVVAALNSGTAAGDELAAMYHREAPLTDTDLARAAELIEIAGGRRWSQDSADGALAEALGELDHRPASNAAAELAALARLATRRDH